MEVDTSRSKGSLVTLAGVFVAALVLIGGSGAAPLAPGDDFRIDSSKFEGTTATFVVTNTGTTNLAVLQATFPTGTRVLGGSSSPSAAACAGGGALPNAGGCFFTEQAPWPPGSTRSFTFQLDVPPPDGEDVELCATSQFGGTDTCQDVVVRTEKPCTCSDIFVKSPPKAAPVGGYTDTSFRYELKWELHCEGGPGACAGEIRVSLDKRSGGFPDAKLRRPLLDVSCKGNCTAKDPGTHRVRSGALLFQIVAKESLHPSFRKNKTLVVRFRTFCASDNEPRRTFELLVKFDVKGKVDRVRRQEVPTPD